MRDRLALFWELIRTKKKKQKKSTTVIPAVWNRKSLTLFSYFLAPRAAVGPARSSPCRPSPRLPPPPGESGRSGSSGLGGSCSASRRLPPKQQKTNKSELTSYKENHNSMKGEEVTKIIHYHTVAAFPRKSFRIKQLLDVNNVIVVTYPGSVNTCCISWILRLILLLWISVAVWQKLWGRCLWWGVTMCETNRKSIFSHQVSMFVFSEYHIGNSILYSDNTLKWQKYVKDQHAIAHDCKMESRRANGVGLFWHLNMLWSVRFYWSCGCQFRAVFGRIY